MRSESWLRLMSSLVLVGVFAAGALFGVGVMRWTAPDQPRTRPPGGRPGSPIAAMTRELALDPAQVAALTAIVDGHQGELEGLAHETQNRVRRVLFAIEDELAPKLRPDQVEKLTAWRARRPPPPVPGMHPPGGGPRREPPGGPPGGEPPF